MRALFAIPLLLGLASLALGAVWSFIAASVNMSFKNPLPRAGCAFLLAGALLIALGIWGLRP